MADVKILRRMEAAPNGEQSHTAAADDGARGVILPPVDFGIELRAPRMGETAVDKALEVRAAGWKNGGRNSRNRGKEEGGGKISGQGSHDCEAPNDVG